MLTEQIDPVVAATGGVRFDTDRNGHVTRTVRGDVRSFRDISWFIG